MTQIPLRLAYDSEANAAYLQLVDEVAEGAAVENVVIERPGKGDVVLDFDAAGRLLGVELIGAAELLHAAVLDAAERI